MLITNIAAFNCDLIVASTGDTSQLLWNVHIIKLWSLPLLQIKAFFDADVDPTSFFVMGSE
jgi:hypothetical protein